MKAFTISDCLDMARRMNATAATVKSWRLGRSIDRRMKKEAHRINQEEQGYILATPVELAQRYPDFFSEDGNSPDAYDPMIWAFYPGLPKRRGRVQLALCPVHKF